MAPRGRQREHAEAPGRGPWLAKAAASNGGLLARLRTRASGQFYGQLLGGGAFRQAATMALVHIALYEMLQLDTVDISDHPGSEFLGLVAHRRLLLSGKGVERAVEVTRRVIAYRV